MYCFDFESRFLKCISTSVGEGKEDVSEKNLKTFFINNICQRQLYKNSLT